MSFVRSLLPEMWSALQVPMPVNLVSNSSSNDLNTLGQVAEIGLSFHWQLRAPPAPVGIRNPPRPVRPTLMAKTHTHHLWAIHRVEYDRRLCEKPSGEV